MLRDGKVTKNREQNKRIYSFLCRDAVTSPSLMAKLRKNEGNAKHIPLFFWGKTGRRGDENTRRYSYGRSALSDSVAGDWSAERKNYKENAFSLAMQACLYEENAFSSAMQAYLAVEPRSSWTAWAVGKEFMAGRREIGAIAAEKHKKTPYIFYHQKKNVIFANHNYQSIKN